MTNTENTSGFGLTTWDEKNQTSKPEPRNDAQKLQFVRLKEGNNVVRIVTAPAKYWHVKFLDANSKYGTRVNCAYPGVDRSECPTVKAGYKPKKRYLAGVLHRSDEGTEVKLLDMSVLVYEQLQNFGEDEAVGSPDSYDINIRFNPKASSPQGFYTVIPRGKSALSDEDQSLIESTTSEVINENLTRLCTPPAPERVEAFLKKLGWNGKNKNDEGKEEVKTEESDSEFTASSDDDYSFDKKN